MALGTPTNRQDGGSDQDFKVNTGAGAPDFRADPAKYSTIDQLIGDYAKPDVREQLIKTYGDQGITGFLKLTGAISAAATQDEVTYFEEGRRHKLLVSTSTGLTGATSYTIAFADGNGPQAYDVLMAKNDGTMWYISAVSDGNDGDAVSATINLLNSSSNTAIADTESFILVGNMYPQGTAQPGEFVEPGVVKRVNPFMIIKDRYQVNGSQATNLGYVNLGNGDYRWYIKGEQDARARFEDKREMMMLLAEKHNATNIAGSEGYFSALNDRGIVQTGLAATPFSAMSEFDNIIKELDKEGAPAEYAMYLNRTQDLAIDDLLATGIATQVTAGLSGQFGAFNNSADMAVELGFKSFTRGGYTFHKHDWKLLNDPTLLGAVTSTDSGVSYQGAMVPMTQVVDAKSGIKAPALEMNYKAANGYSREMEHWVTGGGVLGFNNNGDDGKDVATFHYRSEINLITRAANQHVLLKG